MFASEMKVSQQRMRSVAVRTPVAAVILFLGAVVLTLIGCTHGSNATTPRHATQPANQFVGKWENQSRTAGFEFMANGTGNVEAIEPLVGDTNSSFTYTLRDSQTAIVHLPQTMYAGEDVMRIGADGRLNDGGLTQGNDLYKRVNAIKLVR